VIRRATPAAVAELRPGTGVICCPAASARWRSSHQEVLPGQLRHRDPGQQLPGPETAIPLLHRPDRRIQRPDHAQPLTQPGDRGHPPVRGQRPVRRADAHLRALPLPTAYPSHQIGASRLGTILTSQTNIIPGHSGTYRHLRSRVTVLIADSGLTRFSRFTPIVQAVPN